MRFLFIHPNFPSQHGPLAAALAQDKRHQVVFLTAKEAGQLPGVTKVLFKEAREVAKETHHYVRGLEGAVLQGQAAYRACMELKARGFIPDVILGHSGWGATLYVKDAFPKSALVCNFEWYYSAYGADSDFDPSEPLTPDDQARIRTRNAAILLDLAASDGGIAPTKYQKEQFPKIFHPMLEVMHEGVNTDFFSPEPGTKLVLPRIGLDLSGAKEIVTYVSRGLEPVPRVSPVHRGGGPAAQKAPGHACRDCRGGPGGLRPQGTGRQDLQGHDAGKIPARSDRACISRGG